MSVALRFRGATGVRGYCTGRPSRFHDENWSLLNLGGLGPVAEDTSLMTTGLRPMQFFHPYHTTRSGFHGMGLIVDLYYRCRTEMVLRLALTLFSCSGAASAKVVATSPHSSLFGARTALLCA